MPYAFLADLVVGLHFLFVVFVVLGGLLVLHWPRMAWVHLPAAVWGAAIEFAGWICPLTPLEKWLRGRAGAGAGVGAGADAYTGGFIEHYILPVLYPAGLTRGLQLALGTAVVLGNGIVYWWVMRRLEDRGSRVEGRGPSTL